MRIAVQNATVVKKPKAFCSLTKAECILFVVQKSDDEAYVATL